MGLAQAHVADIASCDSGTQPAVGVAKGPDVRLELGHQAGQVRVESGRQVGQRTCRGPGGPMMRHDHCSPIGPGKVGLAQSILQPVSVVPMHSQRVCRDDRDVTGLGLQVVWRHRLCRDQLADIPVVPHAATGRQHGALWKAAEIKVGPKGCAEKPCPSMPQLGLLHKMHAGNLGQAAQIRLGLECVTVKVMIAAEHNRAVLVGTSYGPMDVDKRNRDFGRPIRTTSKVSAQDGLLSRASKKLVSDEGLFIELGPSRLDRELQKYIWNGKDHLSLRDLWEYLNRYTYLPRIKDRAVLAKAVQAAIHGMVPGVFAYAQRWDGVAAKYVGLAIQNAGNSPVVIDGDSVIIQPAVAERQLAAAIKTEFGESGRPYAGDHPDTSSSTATPTPLVTTGAGTVIRAPVAPTEKNPTRFTGTVMISAERPAHEMRQIVEAIVEQLTTLPGSEVTLRLEIDAEVPSGLDRSKVRTLLENATTLAFIEKVIR